MVGVVVTEFTLAEGASAAVYFYVCLDADAAEIADWGPFDSVEEAMTMLAQDAPAATWEEVSLPPDAALRMVRDRLGHPARR